MKTQKVIIVSQAPLTPQIERNSYFKQLLGRGFNTEFWDVSQIIHPGLILNDEYETEHHLKFNNLIDFCNSIERNDNTHTIYLLDFDSFQKNKQLFDVFSKNKCICFRIDMYGNTSPVDSLLNKIRKLFQKDGIKTIKKVIRNLINKRLNATSLNFKFERYLSSNRFVKRTDVINHPDYDEYLNNTDLFPVDEPFILFIDTYFGFHPDSKYIYNDSTVINVEQYYKDLDYFFNYIEEKYQLPIIIAAHPKMKDENNQYKGRPVIKYKTLPLIRAAQHVIVQVCNTFSWLTLLNKSILLISTDEYLKDYNNKRVIKILCNNLNLHNYNLSREPFEKIKFVLIPYKKRMNYIFNYLTSPETKYKSNIDILDDIISQY